LEKRENVGRKKEGAPRRQKKKGAEEAGKRPNCNSKGRKSGKRPEGHGVRGNTKMAKNHKGLRASRGHCRKRGVR